MAHSFLRIELYVEIRYLIASFQSYKLLNLPLLVYGIVTQKKKQVNIDHHSQFKQ